MEENISFWLQYGLKLLLRKNQLYFLHDLQQGFSQLQEILEGDDSICCSLHTTLEIFLQSLLHFTKTSEVFLIFPSQYVAMLIFTLRFTCKR